MRDSQRLLPPEAQRHNCDHLLQMARHQEKVRNCDVEGSVFNIERQIWHAYLLGLITRSQLEERSFQEYKTSYE